MRNDFKVIIIQMMIIYVASKNIDPEPPDKNATSERKDGKQLLFDIVTFPNNPCFSFEMNRVSNRLSLRGAQVVLSFSYFWILMSKVFWSNRHSKNAFNYDPDT